MRRLHFASETEKVTPEMYRSDEAGRYVELCQFHRFVSELESLTDMIVYMVT